MRRARRASRGPGGANPSVFLGRNTGLRYIDGGLGPATPAALSFWRDASVRAPAAGRLHKLLREARPVEEGKIGVGMKL